MNNYSIIQITRNEIDKVSAGLKNNKPDLSNIGIDLGDTIEIFRIKKHSVELIPTEPKINTPIPKPEVQTKHISKR